MKNADENPFCQINDGQTFIFSCGPHVSCFNECCRDLNQFLTPYDVLRLKNHLEMTSERFFETYCRRHDGPRTGLPMVTLRPQPGPELKCPFVSPEGCRVYEDRPASCRMYPIARMAGRDRRTGVIREQFMLIRESHCNGFADGPELTAPQWMKHQGLEPYNAANDAMIELIGIKQLHCHGQLPPSLSERIFVALYDLDRFRALLPSGEIIGIDSRIRDEMINTAFDEVLLDRTLDCVARWLKSDTA